jgi:hypothetical protein
MIENKSEVRLVTLAYLMFYVSVCVCAGGFFLTLLNSEKFVTILRRVMENIEAKRNTYLA